MSSKRILITLACLTALGAAVFFIPLRLPSFRPRAGVAAEEWTVVQRPMSFGVNATGFLRATSVQNFGPPPAFGHYWEFQIVSLAPEGKAVKKGDLLASFTVQEMTTDLEKYQNEMDQAAKELEKTKVQIDLERQNIVSLIAAAENKYEKLKLKQADPGSLIDVSLQIELDKLALEQAKREVELLKERLDWQKKSSEATYQVIVSKKARAENAVKTLQQGMEKLQAKSDRDGVVVYKVKWNGDKYKVGESIWLGRPVIEIPDLNTILAQTYVPEVDLGKVKIGQRVEISIDAFPGKTYPGKVMRIDTLVHTKAWDIQNKILEVEVAFDQLDTSIMRPAMSIKAKIETGSRANCMAVPLGAIRTTAEGSLVKVKTESGWKDQPVRLGESNGTDVVITEGLNVGDRIAADFSKAK